MKIESRSDHFNKRTQEPILIFKKAAENGVDDVEVYCEDPDGAILHQVYLRDINDPDRIYKVYIEDGNLESHEVIPPPPNS